MSLARIKSVSSWIRSPDIGTLGASGWAAPQGADPYVEEDDAVQARELVFALFGDM